MSEDDINWSDWIEHKGGGCPLPVGTMVCRVFNDEVAMISGREVPETFQYTGPIIKEEWASWLGCPVVCPLGPVAQVVRYRIWRPRGVRMLLRIAENPREKADHHAG